MRSSRLITSYKSEIRSLDPTKNYSDINLSAQNNPFGSIAQGMFPVSTSAGFIPLDSNGTILDIRDGYVNPQWLGLRTTSMQYWAYTFCSPLAAVIDRLAESDTNGLIRLIGED
jgi:hypothetical protein